MNLAACCAHLLRGALKSKCNTQPLSTSTSWCSRSQRQTAAGEQQLLPQVQRRRGTNDRSPGHAADAEQRLEVKQVMGNSMNIKNTQTSKHFCYQVDSIKFKIIQGSKLIFTDGFARYPLKLCLCLITLCFVSATFAQDERYTQMSLSSDGKLIALGYVDKNKNEVVDIAKLSYMPNLKARRLSLGKVQPFTFAFGIDPESLLITTNGESKHDLLRVNVANLNSPKIETLHSHPFWLRFPKEMEGHKVVFLEQIDGKDGVSRWRIVDGTTSADTRAQLFVRASWPSIVGGNVFLPIPIKGKGIADIVGTTPKAIREFYDTSDGFMVCADTPDSIACLKNDVTILMTESYGELIVNKGGRICRVPGQWKDSYPIEISRNGKYAVFQGIPRGGKQRGVYLIETNDKDCRSQLINITKGN
jgi:hypothetical protein